MMLIAYSACHIYVHARLSHNDSVTPQYMKTEIFYFKIVLRVTQTIIQINLSSIVR